MKQAYVRDDFETFEKMVHELGTDDLREMIAYVVWGRVGETRYLDALLAHPCSTVDPHTTRSFIHRYDGKPGDTLVEKMIEKTVPKNKKELSGIIGQAVYSGDFHNITATVRQMIREKFPCDELAWLLYTRITSEYTEDPIGFINAYVDGGVDIRGFEFLVSEYVRFAKKFVPDVVRTLFKYGVPKKSAYVTKYMKSQRYMSRLLMVL
jgi:hypothetical protein